jgi:phosphoglycerate kinase
MLKTCKTLVWNGPMGAFETVPFDAATVALAKIAAALTKEGSLVSVAGGGDTVAALHHAGVAISATSRPRAALSSNGWKGACCPA